MKKIIVYIFVLSIVSVIFVSIEKVSEKILDLKVTELQYERDKIENENRALKDEISKKLKIKNLNDVAETNKYFKPKETDIIHLKND